MFACLRQYLRDESGTAASQIALVGALLTIAIIAAVGDLPEAINGVMSTASGLLENADDWVESAVN